MNAKRCAALRGGGCLFAGFTTVVDLCCRLQPPKVCLRVTAGGLRMSLKANSKTQPTQAWDLELESTTSRQQTASKLASTDTPTATRALSIPPK